MGILVLLAVFTAEATDGSGRGFAVVYATYQVIQTGLWYTVWLQDRRDHPEFLATTAGYVVGMGVSATVIGASAFLSATPRLLVWAGLGVAWIVGIVLAARGSRAGLGLTPPTRWSSASGCSPSSCWARSCWGWWPACRGSSVTPRHHHRDAGAVAGLRVLVDLLRPGRPAAAQGQPCRAGELGAEPSPHHGVDHGGRAGMVSLIGHAHDATTPAGTSWLLAGAVASGLVALVLTEQALADAERLAVVFHPLGWRCPEAR